MMNDELVLDPARSALVLIDLQRGIVARETAPHPAAQVVANAARLADAFRARGGFVVLVHVDFSPDRRDALKPPVDAPNPPAPPPAGWADFVPEVGPREGDHVVTKRQWGAFYGTDLDLQLRRRGIDTLVLGGIATNYGVESTARDAFERGYAQVLVEDATTTFDADAHALALKFVFRRLARVRSTEVVLAALG
jgi:nicotinamidase-related amidase